MKNSSNSSRNLNPIKNSRVTSYNDNYTFGGYSDDNITDDDGFIIVSRTSHKPRTLPPPITNARKQPQTKNLTNLTILQSKTFSLSTKKQKKLKEMATRPKLYLHHPKMVPRTTSKLPEYRDFFPATKSLKEFFDANPIEQMTLETARKTYGRCVKNALGCFVPGHHPDQMSMSELIPELHRERKRVIEEYPKNERQSLRIKEELTCIAEARKHLPKKLYIHKDFPLQHVIGLTNDQLKAMLHDYCVKALKEPPSFRTYSDKDDLMVDFRYEVLLLKQKANEINVPANSTNMDINIHYEHSSCEKHECSKKMPKTLVVTPSFPIDCLPLLNVNMYTI